MPSRSEMDRLGLAKPSAEGNEDTGPYPAPKSDAGFAVDVWVRACEYVSIKQGSEAEINGEEEDGKVDFSDFPSRLYTGLCSCACSSEGA